MIQPGQSPRELNRLDSKNWSPTPAALRDVLNESFRAIAEKTAALILMDQVDVPETGVFTEDLLEAVREIAMAHPDFLMLADSRRSLKGWPPLWLKMNNSELAALADVPLTGSLDQIKSTAASLARSHGRPVFVTLAEQGIVGAEPAGVMIHQTAFPVRGEIDIVGAGDAVTANLTAALAAGAELREALELAMAAASIVIHQLGTTGTASVDDLRALLFRS